jgi:hypothetical protein
VKRRNKCILFFFVFVMGKAYTTHYSKGRRNLHGWGKGDVRYLFCMHLHELLGWYCVYIGLGCLGDIDGWTNGRTYIIYRWR